MSASDISLSWASSGTSVTGFEIQRKVGDAGTFSTLAQVPAGQVQYGDASLSSNTTYVYRIRSLAGALTSTFSSESTATTAASTAPTDVAGGARAPGGKRRERRRRRRRRRFLGLLGVEVLLFLLGSSAGRRLPGP